MSTLHVCGYLARLGFDSADAATIASAPSIVALAALHRAHVQRVPYETLEFQLDRRTTIDPHESADRIIAGRGGYCFQLNGAFSALLDELGYDVRCHTGGVQCHGSELPVGANGNHLALTVHDLPASASPGGAWLVDVGLGDSLHEPLPLRPGRYRQGPFEYRLRRSDAAPGGWRLDHDPAGAFIGLDLALDRADLADFAAMHEELSTSPDSSFVRVATVQRRHRDGADILRGCVLTEVTEAGRREQVVDTPAAWFALLHTRFGLVLDGFTSDDRARLWSRVTRSHRDWVASTRSSALHTPPPARNTADLAHGCTA